MKYIYIYKHGNILKVYQRPSFPGRYVGPVSFNIKSKETIIIDNLGPYLISGMVRIDYKSNW